MKGAVITSTSGQRQRELSCVTAHIKRYLSVFFYTFVTLYISSYLLYPFPLYVYCYCYCYCTVLLNAGNSNLQIQLLSDFCYVRILTLICPKKE